MARAVAGSGPLENEPLPCTFHTQPLKPLPLPVTEAHEQAFRNDLLNWYEVVQRDMPWRRTRDPYRIWLSEVMLQQTRVDQAEPYYHWFLERFPDVGQLAESSLDEVLQCWEGLGYYTRARNLHRAARMVVRDFGGHIPADEESFRSLPGVGAYTCAAVMSIAHGKPRAVLDGNVVRVLTRVFRVNVEVERSATRQRLLEAAQRLIHRDQPGAFNQALMELGATVCLPASPQCPACPLRPVCAAAKHGDQKAYPVRTPRKKTPRYDIAVGLVSDEAGRLLIQRRDESAMLGGLWEFPGGKRGENESLEETCRREWNEELGVTIAVGELFHQLLHAYSHFSIALYAFRARIVEGSPRSRSGQPLKWASRSDLSQFAFPRANRRLIDRIMMHPQEFLAGPQASQ